MGGVWASWFVHPGLALAAVLLAALPLIIHLLNRRRPQRMRWAAMALLEAAYRRSTRRLRAHRLLLLTLRVLAVLCIGLALARPLLDPDALRTLSGVRTHQVLVIDDTLAMRLAQPDGASRFDHAIREALALLDTLPTEDPVSLVALSTAEVRAERVTQRRSVRAQLAAMTASQVAGNPAATFAQLAGYVEADDRGADRVALHLITCLPRGVWSSAALADQPAWAQALQQLPERVRLHVIGCGAGASPNVAITRFAARQRRATIGAPLELEIDLTCFGAPPADTITLQILHDGRVLARADVPDLPADALRTLDLTIPAPAAGPIVITARLASPHRDALPDDDQRYLALDVLPATPVLVVASGSPFDRMPHDARYLAAALAPQVADGAPPRFAIHPIGVEDFANEPLEEFPLVVLCNVPGLAADGWLRLSRYVHAGGGLLVTCGPALDPAAWDTDLLPARLVDVEAAPGGNPLRVALPDVGDPLFGSFAAVPESGLFRARIDAFARVADLAPGATVRARLSNAAPLIVEQARGAGRVALFCTTVDMAWTNLPAKGDFAALVQILADHLVRDDAASRSLLAGDAYCAQLSPLAAAQLVSVIGPRQSACAAEVSFREGHAHMVCADTAEAGGYRATTVDGVHAFAVNVDSAASDPACLTADDLRRWIARPVTFGGALAGAAGPRRAAPIATLDEPLIWVGLVLLLLEMGVSAKAGTPGELRQ